MSSSQDEINKSFNVMRFGSALNVDPNKWKSCQMFRESDLKDIKAENETDLKEFGAGSEFGRKQKEEMRKKKYAKKGSAAQQPWVLKTSGKGSRKYKGLREGGVSENASYYVFFQAPDGAFEAFPVQEWYNFTPIQRYKALTAEEAEEKFEKRDKILNYFSVMINKKRKDDEMAEKSGESKAKIKKELKVSDMDDWQGMDSDNERSDADGRSDEDVKPKMKNKKDLKKKKMKSNKKKKGSDDDDDDSEPLEESDEGDFDDKEVDYMSDSSDDSDESETEKNDKEMKSVMDEDALRQLVLSEDEDEEEEKEGEQNDKEGDKSQETDKNANENDKKSKFKDRLQANFDSPPPSSSDSDSDDPDSVDDRKSALLAPVKLESDKSSRGSSRSATPTALLETNSNDSSKLKRKLVQSESHSVKRSKLSSDNSEVVTEEAVRRYLMRKPMTAADLLQKFKNKVSVKTDLVQTMAQILKRLNPEKQTIKDGKTQKTYFSLKPS